MRLGKSVAILVVGILIGMALSSRVPPIAAQGVTNPPRLSLISGNAAATGLAGLSSLNFVKDSRTNACWLMASTAQNVALTPAPTDACQ